MVTLRALVDFTSCFDVLQEKMKGKNKLVPRLLGITKESVMRVDEKTKEVIQEWNLTNIKRWAASPKSFTLVSPSRRDTMRPLSQANARRFYGF